MAKRTRDGHPGFADPLRWNRKPLMESQPTGANPYVTPSTSSVSMRGPDWPLRQTVWKISQIARELGCTDRAVRFWCEAKLLRAHQTHGGHYRVMADDLLAYVNRSNAMPAFLAA